MHNRHWKTYILKYLPATLPIGRFGTCHAIANTHELPVDVFHSRGDGISDNFLNLLLDKASRKRLERLIP